MDEGQKAEVESIQTQRLGAKGALPCLAQLRSSEELGVCWLSSEVQRRVVLLLFL
jgi:hypothetical protein